ncbi:MAG TPA: 6-phosphogluconolactonase [Longimicrobiales bacterium]|nr:6-phosphogluconolactonase [Longimicrobiales bacterium]
MNVRAFTSRAEFDAAAADHFYRSANAAIAKSGRFTVALTGGTTPSPVYELMATPEYARLADWRLIQVFWGDERCVGPEDPQSNDGMAQRTLLSRVPIPQENIHRIRGELDPATAAAEYEKVVRDVVSESFDLIILGMGSDGHIASLFPNSPLLQEKARWVASQYVEKVKMARVTLTPVAINRAHAVVFWVAGDDKQRALSRVLDGPRDPALLPAQIVAPRGELTWLTLAKR